MTGRPYPDRVRDLAGPWREDPPPPAEGPDGDPDWWFDQARDEGWLRELEGRP